MPRSTPYAIQARRVAMARPFRSVDDVKKALETHDRGGSIGFSRKASLVAMGLLPRADGSFRVSTKYQMGSP